ncbi:protein split ends-like, partial [Penaeus japonicus]|uniref:protein split ends-like n=1 Tax=Penaeus japonicus TaxID=27405 RepID=UPI001C70D067
LPLFDPDCGVISAESITTLHQNLNSLASLTTVVTAIRDCAKTNMITMKGAGELESRVQVVSLLMLHLSVVLWFYHCGLLSHSPTEDIEECHVPFPADLLCRIYKNRRSEIKRLSTTLNGAEILMIDGLLEDMNGGGSIGKAWEKEGGSGLYPPPSLHALLAIFLLPDISTTTKHRIVQYLFLDLASLLSDGYTRVVEELVKYPSSFSLSPSHIKLTQAFGLLDHKDFQEGLNVLLDPLVNTNNITHSQHRRIVKAFLYQGEHTRALTYAQIRQPPKVDLDDIRLHLTLLLANGLIREAFHYQRTHRVKDNSEDLLNHLFTGCEQLGKLECVVHLPLSPLEEDALVSYLRTSSYPAAQDYLLVYYLQRARYDEAAVLQNSLRGGLGTAKKRQGARSALIHGYLTHLPDVAKKLSSANLSNRGPTHTVYSKPQPLSAQIRQAASSPKTAATSFNKMIQREQDTWPVNKGATTPYTPFRSKAQRRRGFGQAEALGFGDINSPKLRDSIRDISHTVFPSRVEASQCRYVDDEGDIGLFSPAIKRSRQEVSLLNDDTSRLMESVLRKNIHGSIDVNASVSQNISSDLLSLLQTPKIARKRKPLNRSVGESPLADTPQSILKVRQMVQRPMSPSATSDTSIPVFPRITKRASISTAEDVVTTKANDTSMTPKQLRFHLPKARAESESNGKGDSLDREEDDDLAPLKLIDDEEEEDAMEEEEREDIDEPEEEEEVEEEEEEEEDVDEEEEKEQEIVQEESVEMEEEEPSKETEEMEDLEAEEEETEEMECNNEATDVEETGSENLITVLPHPEIHNKKLSPVRRKSTGIPSPRQPLPGYVAKTTRAEAVLPQSVFKECVDADEMNARRASDDEADIEYPSRETTVNEDFYSFTEEDEFNISEKSAISATGDKVAMESEVLIGGRVDQRELDTQKESEIEEKIENTLEVLQNNDCGIIEVQRVEYALETSKQEVSRQEEKISTVIEKEDTIEKEMHVPKEPETKEEMVQQKLNESEHIVSLQFSDSESDDELATKVQFLEEASNEKSQKLVSEENGGDVENEEEVLEKLSEEEEEMICEALSEEEDLSLALDTTERFSPLRFSDSESDSDGGSGGNQEEVTKRNGTDTTAYIELSGTKNKEEKMVDTPQKHPVSVQVFKTEIVSETKIIRKTVETPLPEESIFTGSKSETISVENNNEQITKNIEQNRDVDETEKGESVTRNEEQTESHASSTNGSSELTHKVADTTSSSDLSKSSTGESEDQSGKLEVSSAQDSMDVDEEQDEGMGEVGHEEKDKEVEVKEPDNEGNAAVEVMEKEMGKSVVDSVDGSIESVSVEKENMEIEETDGKASAESESQQELEAEKEPEVGRLDVTPSEDTEPQEEKTGDKEDCVSAVDSAKYLDIVETRDSQVSKKAKEMIQEAVNSPPRESPTPLRGSETPTRKAEEMPEASRVASVRRSRRLSTSSPATPSTPRRSRRTSGSTADEPVTPAHKSLLSEVAFERVTRSGRKIGQVPTPVTKKRATSPASNLVTSGRIQRRASVAAEEVQKVTQRLELSTDEIEEAPAAVQQPDSVSIATHDVLPTPPSSPTTPSTRRRRRQSSGEAEASVTKSPSRRSTRQSALDESLGTIQEEADVSESLEIKATKGRTTPRKLEGTPNKATPTKATPTRTRRKSAKQAESLETIKEDAELSTGIVPLVLDEQITGTPSRRTRRSLAGETSRTPVTQTLEEVTETTPETKTPSRTRKRSISKSEATPEVKTPMRTRRQSGASDVSDIGQEAKTPTRRTRKSVTKETSEVTPEAKTPSRTRRQSVSSDVSEAAQETRTPTRRTRQSISKEVAETVLEARTPTRTRRQSASSEVSEAASETQIQPRGRRQSISEGMTEVVPKARTPSQKSKKSQSAKSTRRRTIQVLQSEEEFATESTHRLISIPSPGSEVSQRSPDRMSTRSSVNSPLTSIKDSESSEEEELSKKRPSKQPSGKTGRKSLAVERTTDESTATKRKSRRLTSSTLPTATVSELPEKIKSGKASRKSIVSSKLYADTDTGQSTTPEIGATRRGRTSKRSSAASTSVLLLEESRELPDEEEEMVLEGGEDVFEAVDEEVAEAETEAQDSPDVSLLMEASSRGRRKRSRALSLLSAPKEGRKLSALPKRSLTSMRLATDSSQDEEAAETKVKKTRKASRRTTTADSTILELDAERRESVGEKEEEEEQEQKVEKVEKKRRSVKKAKSQVEKKGMPVDVDVALEKKLKAVQETAAATEREAKAELRKAKAQEEAANKDTKEEQVTQFHFATPKPVISSRKARALEHLMGEAVEFLFSPPLAEGRIVKTHAKIEEARGSSSESETETVVPEKSFN